MINSETMMIILMSELTTHAEICLLCACLESVILMKSWWHPGFVEASNSSFCQNHSGTMIPPNSLTTDSNMRINIFYDDVVTDIF